MKDFSRRLEICCLAPDLSSDLLDEKIEWLKEKKGSGLIVPSFWVKKVARELEQSDFSIGVVVGFPFGFQQTVTKVQEAKDAIAHGVMEVMVTFHHSAFSSGMNWPKIEVAQLAKICHEESCFLSVIIEPEWIPSEEKLIEAVMICQDAGADFIVLGTGLFHTLPGLKLIGELRSQLSSQIGLKLLVKTLEGHAIENYFKAGVDKICLDYID